MPTGIMIGPYARQLVLSAYTVAGPVGPDLALGRLKFWYAFKPTKSAPIMRYEALIGRGDSTFAMRRRHSPNFHNYRLPEDLTAFPSLPLKKGDTLATAALALLRGEDIAGVTRMRLIGALPTRQIWHLTENETCTSNQPLLI